jgi:RimJ/RimL family protein N-acetyltransferase
MKRPIPPFGDDLVRLRLLTRGDLDTTLAWRNRDEVRVWFKTPDPIRAADHYRWFDRYLARDDDFLFVIEAQDVAVGQASVYGIDWARGVAEIGRFLAAPGQGGKGYLRRACGQLVQCCQEQLQLSYLFLEVFAANERAVRLYAGAGFVEESRTADLIRMSRRLEPSARRRTDATA